MDGVQCKIYEEDSCTSQSPLKTNQLANETIGLMCIDTGPLLMVLIAGKVCIGRMPTSTKSTTV